MSAMTELIENGVIRGVVVPVEDVTAAVEYETSLVAAFEDILEIPQDVGLTECAFSEETDTREKSEKVYRQHNGQADTSSTQSVWAVGAQCRAVWSGDGQVYLATVVAVDGERCRVCFSGYGNEEDMELSTLMSPNTLLQTQIPDSLDWKPGSRCRAVYSEDGLVYPAVILWVHGQRCRVRFDGYNNEEELDVSSLLTHNELHGPIKAIRKQAKERSSSQSKVERDGDDKTRGGDQQRNESEKAANRSLPLFPQFPPLSGLGGPPSFFPPPPWSIGEKESGSSPAIDGTLDSMLMLWYMCGYYTGSYMAEQQFRSASKD
uniref:survival motor neuron protein-like isoform X1 n=1 Tax=Monopterus albus TaxID=43700 RepID=UPI0009B3372E|nr:survival motor neuron protein-like isoform X1 [Monopterus albus]XP_020464717.1 survival motor neuron protein-like isoform X1 [Monopterus albus]